MGNVKVVPNDRTLHLSVALGVKEKPFKIEVEPNHALVDKAGYIRLITHEFDDGVVGNFQLLPKHGTLLDIGEKITMFVTDYGLRKAGSKIFKGNVVIAFVVKYLVETYGTDIVIRDFFGNLTLHDSSYFAIDTNELVFAHPIHLKPEAMPRAWRSG